MNYKAQIKEITKVNKPAFGDGIFTYKITTTKHTGLYYTSKLSLKVNDEIDYDYVMQKNNDYKFKDVKKVAMYDNYNKQEKTTYQNQNDSRQQSIEYQSARNVISQLYSGLGNQITLDEIAEKTVYLYNKQQEFFNNK